MWPVGGKTKDRELRGSEKVEQWRRVEVQALTALCETKKVWNV